MCPELRLRPDGGPRHHVALRTGRDPVLYRRDDSLGGLLDRYLLSGDEEAMDEIVFRTRGRLLAVARRIGHPQDAEDAVQTAYFSLIRKRGERLEAPVRETHINALANWKAEERINALESGRVEQQFDRPDRVGFNKEALLVLVDDTRAVNDDALHTVLNGCDF